MDGLLRDFGPIIPLIALIVASALLAWPVLAAHRRQHRSTRHAIVTAAMDLTLTTVSIVVLLLVFLPMDSDTSTVDLLPGDSIIDAVGDDGTLLQVCGNALLLSPLGALAPLRIPPLKSVGRIALTALILSILIETIQYLMHAGRSSSTDDVILNTFGATLGAVATRRWWSRLPRRTPPQRVPVQRRRLPVSARPSRDDALNVSLRPPSPARRPRP